MSMRTWEIGVEEQMPAEGGDKFYAATPAMIRLYARVKAPVGLGQVLVSGNHSTLANALHDLADQIASAEDFEP